MLWAPPALTVVRSAAPSEGQNYATQPRLCSVLIGTARTATMIHAAKGRPCFS
jgi:hypothetical protein